jgi:hypothetical protein
LPVPLRETARGSCSGFRDPCTGGRRASSSRSPPRTHSGSRWARGRAYSNPDYLVLGLIVEAAGAAGRWPATCSGASRRRCGCAPRAWTMPRASPAPTRTATSSPLEDVALVTPRLPGRPGRSSRPPATSTGSSAPCSAGACLRSPHARDADHRRRLARVLLRPGPAEGADAVRRPLGPLGTARPAASHPLWCRG